MLLLFDIDGTLVSGGPAKAAFRVALEETFGTAGPIDGHDFAGKTDPQIARELLTAAGVPARDLEAGRERFRGRYRAELERRIVSEPMTPLPGVRRLVEALADDARAFLGLVTGNLKEGARLKLDSVGLWRRFPVGGYGSDSEVRNELGPLAVRRAAAHWEMAFDAAEVVIVGDTPRDVECGKAAGATTVAVATGRFSASQLRRAGADRVLEDFADTGRAIEALTPGRLPGAPAV